MKNIKRRKIFKKKMMNHKRKGISKGKAKWKKKEMKDKYKITISLLVG